MDTEKMLDVLGLIFAHTEHGILIEAYDGENVRAVMGRADEAEAHAIRWVEVKGCRGAFGVTTIRKGCTYAERLPAEVPAVALSVEASRVNGMMDCEHPPTVVLQEGGVAYGIWILDGCVSPDDPSLAALLEELDTNLSVMVPLPGQPGVEILEIDENRIHKLSDLVNYFRDSDLPPADSVEVSIPLTDVRNEVDMNQVITLAFGPGKDGKTGTWKTSSATLKHLVGALTVHQIGPKDGPAFLQGSSFGGSRQTNSMETLYIIGVDIDNGMPSKDIDAILKEKGVFAIRYTTHSHGKNFTDVKKDAFVKFQKENQGATAEDFLLKVKHYLPEAARGARITDTFGKAEGIYNRISHQPMDKNRIICVLKQPWNVTAYETQDEAIKAWKRAYAAFCQWLGNIPYDHSCIDPSRLFYMPRCEKGAAKEAVVHEGRAVDIFSLPPADFVPGVDRGRGGNVYMAAAGDLGAKDGDLPGWLLKWAAQNKSRCMLAELLEARVPEIFRPEFDNKPGFRHIECPFEELHSTPGGAGTFVMNATDSTDGSAVICCQHASCKDETGGDFLHYLNKMVENGWITEDDLYDPEFLVDIEDDDSPVKPVGASQSGERHSKLSPDQFNHELRRIVSKELDEAHAAEAIAELSKEVGFMSRTEIKRAYDRLVREKRQEKKNKEKPSPKVERERKTMYVSGDYRQNADDTLDSLVEANNPPTIFKFDNEISRVVRSDNGQIQIWPFNLQSLRREVSMNSRWLQPMGEELIEVAPPRDIIDDVLATPPHELAFPVLEAVVGTPVFTKSGKLHAEPGYNKESKVFYQPMEDFVLHEVPAKPSDKEVKEAREFIDDNVFVDFPFDNDSERAHIWALLLVSFARNMIDGFTPWHWIDKPSPGTGATKLVNCISLITTGGPSTPVTEETKDDEWKKKITSIIKTGPSMFFIDNVNHRLDSGHLAALATQPYWIDRALGSNETYNTPIRCSLVVAGNNIEMSKELVRRMLRIRLDAKVERPEQRTEFKHEDLEAWVLENRDKLVWCCLTLIQNWVVKGCPKFTDKILNSYENWSRVMGGILAAAGIPGFLVNKEEVQEDTDDETLAIKSFLEVWWATHQTTPYSIKGESSDYQDDDKSLFTLAKSSEPPLPIVASGNNDDSYRMRLGKFLGKLKGRRFTVHADNGDKLVTVEQAGKGSYSRAGLWKLIIQ